MAPPERSRGNNGPDGNDRVIDEWQPIFKKLCERIGLIISKFAQFSGHAIVLERQGVAMSTLSSAQTRFRSARLKRFLVPILRDLARPNGTVRILDIGGVVSYWRPVAAEVEEFNCQVTLANLSEADAFDAAACQFNGRMTFARNDARLISFSDNSFDLVHSNSTIEHVGSWSDMRAMANEVQRLAGAYFVQVPYFWFPIEPHFQTAFFHWLPEGARARILMRTKLGGHSRAKTTAQAMETVRYSQLLDRAQMAALFPNATIECERFCGLTKSLIAIRKP
jgi:hypothetical protein